MRTKFLPLSNMHKKFTDNGFTLVELLVVVVIIAVLAAIAIPIFLNQRTSAQDSVAKSELTSSVKYLRDGLALGTPIVEGNVPAAISGVGSFDAKVTTVKIDPNNGQIFCVRTPSESGKVFYWETTQGYTEAPSTYCLLEENSGGGGGGSSSEEETITDTDNGSTIVVSPDRVRITFGSANWEWLTITYVGENGTITNRVEKNGVSTDGPLAKVSNKEITVSLPNTVQIAVNVKYNGKSTGVIYNL